MPIPKSLRTKIVQIQIGLHWRQRRFTTVLQVAIWQITDRNMSWTTAHRITSCNKKCDSNDKELNWYELLRMSASCCVSNSLCTKPACIFPRQPINECNMLGDFKVNQTSAYIGAIASAYCKLSKLAEILFSWDIR